MGKIRKFIDNNIADQFDYAGLETLEKISKMPDVVYPVVALPDFHLKKKMEAPSSIAVGVKKHIVPHFTSSSVNCGMGALAVNLRADDGVVERIGDFYDTLRIQRSEKKYNLSTAELFKVLHEGPQALKQRFSISDEIINAFEARGNVVDPKKHSLEETTGIIPRDVLEHPRYNGMIDLGTGFGGNHFLEIQKVSKIYDSELCHKHNIREIGQIVIMYHGGGGIIPGFIGAYFAIRTKGYENNFRHLYHKLRYHLPRRNGLKSIPQIYKYFFSQKKYIQIDEDSSQGRRAIHANNIAMNYGYGYRLFMIIRICEALKQTFDIDSKNVQLIKDLSHNSILKEEINGEELWVHRHNAARVVKDSITVLPGFNNTSSYICVGMDNTASTLNTVPHGAGDSIKAYKKAGLTRTIAERSTMIFRDKKRVPEQVLHQSDEGIDAVVNTLKKENLMRPVVKLTPFAVLKDYT